MALHADAWHMGTHSAAFLITIFSYSYAKKNTNNKDFSFGTGEVNYLGGCKRCSTGNCSSNDGYRVGSSFDRTPSDIF